MAVSHCSFFTKQYCLFQEGTAPFIYYVIVLKYLIQNYSSNRNANSNTDFCGSKTKDFL